VPVTFTLELMISDPIRAQAVSAAAEAFIRELSGALESARTSAPPSQFERLKKAVGQVVGTLEVDLLWPLYKQHPSLEPDNLKGWEAGA
jgi:hypothetical protein